MKTLLVTIAVNTVTLIAAPAFAQRYQYQPYYPPQREVQSLLQPSQEEIDSSEAAVQGRGNYNRYAQPRSAVKTVRTAKRVKTSARYYNPRVAQRNLENEVVTQMEPQAVGAEYLNRIYIDIAPLINQGVGGAYERVFGSKLAVGAYGSFSRLETERSKSTGAKNDLMSFGARARYFINGNADESSFYVMGGAQYTSLKTEVDVNREIRKQLQDEGQIFVANSFLYNQEKKVTHSSEGFGGVAGAGYQIAANAFGSSALIIDMGAFYGYGQSSKYEVKRIQFGTNTEVTNEIGYGLFGELNVGLAF